MGRLALSADPRVGMEVMAATSRFGKWWMKAATIARFTFHARNLISGLWQNILGGVGPHETLAMAPDVLRFVRNRRRLHKMEGFWDADIDEMIDGYLLRGISKKNKDVFAQGIRQGILDSTFASTIPRSSKSLRGLRSWNLFNGDNRFFEAGIESMEVIEGILRMSLFKHHYDAAFPYMSGQMAKIMVNMVHFDYTDLSKIDEKIKKFIPFWVWTSRNLPLQMRQLLGNPKMILRYEYARRAWNENFADWEDENRDWYVGGNRWVLPFRQEDDMGNWTQMTWEPALPFEDLLQTPLFKQHFNDTGWTGAVGDEALNPAMWLAWTRGLLAPQYSALAELAVDRKNQYRTTNASGIFDALFRAVRVRGSDPARGHPCPTVDGTGCEHGAPVPHRVFRAGGHRLDFALFSGEPGLPARRLHEPVGYQPRVVGQRVVRGLGINWRSPEDVYWTWKDWQAYVEQGNFWERAMMSAPNEP